MMVVRNEYLSANKLIKIAVLIFSRFAPYRFFEICPISYFLSCMYVVQLTQNVVMTAGGCVMWACESVFYQIYPLGFCGAPFENDGVEASKILKVAAFWKMDKYF